MTDKEIVLRAIEQRDPPRVPVFMFNRDQEKSDILMVHYAPAKSFVPDVPGQTEWGYVMHSVDNTMGQAEDAPLENWENLSSYRPPCADLPERYEPVRKMCERFPQKYIIGDLGLSGFTVYSFLRGFGNTMEDFYLEEENMNALLDQIFAFEECAIERMLQAGVDAVSFYDDWGSQQSLFISLDMWKKFFKHRYKRQFDLIHRYGKHVFFHCCGNILQIIPELIELGADMINLNGLEVMGLEKVAKYRGKICFCCPVDLQSVAIKATREEIFAYTAKMIARLGTEHGGFIGYVEEYSSIGLTEENYWNCYDALIGLGRYEC